VRSRPSDNPQKAARALKPIILNVDEPARGVVVGARVEARNNLFDLAKSGLAARIVSSLALRRFNLPRRKSISFQSAKTCAINYIYCLRRPPSRRPAWGAPPLVFVFCNVTP
jgi:hypothetical protein